MKLIIAGSRGVYPTLEQIDQAFDDFALVRADVSLVLSGGARGADDAGEAWAAARGIPCKRMPAPWDQYGKLAGKVRNKQMAELADAALVFWDGRSNGSADMVTRMVERDKLVRVLRCAS